MALASVANWLFNFAIGLFIPPAFQNISWKLFIIFGVLCFAASAQAFVSYPETAGKTIEEIELLFNDSAVRPWKTKPGQSLLDAKIEEARAARRQNSIRETEMTDAEKGVMQALHKDDDHRDEEIKEDESKTAGTV